MQFVDEKDIADWAVTEINALAGQGYVSGRPGGVFDPKAPLTRAEIVSMIDKITAAYYSEAGTYTGNIAGNVVVNTKNVVLKDMVIEGNLYLTQGIGNGDVTLDNVTVKGNTLVEGGGANSVYFKNADLGAITIKKVGDELRAVFEGKTQVKTVQVESGVKLEAKAFTGAIANVNVGATISATANVNVAVPTDKLGVEAPISVQINAPVGNVVVAKGANGATLAIAKDVTVETLVTDAAIAITGQGKVETLESNATGVTSTIKPGTITGSEKPSTPGSAGGGGGGSSSGGTTTPVTAYSVSGKVTKDGTPVGGVYVTATPYQVVNDEWMTDGESVRVQANELGEFKFASLPKNKSYELSVRYDGDAYADYMAIQDIGVLTGNVVLADAMEMQAYTTIKIELLGTDGKPVEEDVRIDVKIYTEENPSDIWNTTIGKHNTFSSDAWKDKDTVIFEVVDEAYKNVKYAVNVTENKRNLLEIRLEEKEEVKDVVVTTFVALQEALKAGVQRIKVENDIVISESITVGEGQTILTNSTLTVGQGTTVASQDIGQPINITINGKLELQANGKVELQAADLKFSSFEDIITPSQHSVLIYEGSNIWVGDTQYIGSDGLVTLANFENSTHPIAGWFLNGDQKLLLIVFEKATVNSQTNDALDISILVKAGENGNQPAELEMSTFDVLKEGSYVGNGKYTGGTVNIESNGKLTVGSEVVVNKAGESGVFTAEGGDTNNDRGILFQRLPEQLCVTIHGEVNMHKPFLENAVIGPEARTTPVLDPILNIMFEGEGLNNVKLAGIDSVQKGTYAMKEPGVWKLQEQIAVGKLHKIVSSTEKPKVGYTITITAQDSNEEGINAGVSYQWYWSTSDIAASAGLNGTGGIDGQWATFGADGNSNTFTPEQPRDVNKYLLVVATQGDVEIRHKLTNKVEALIPTTYDITFKIGNQDNPIKVIANEDCKIVMDIDVITPGTIGYDNVAVKMSVEGTTPAAIQIALDGMTPATAVAGNEPIIIADGIELFFYEERYSKNGSINFSSPGEYTLILQATRGDREIATTQVTVSVEPSSTK